MTLPGKEDRRTMLTTPSTLFNIVWRLGPDRYITMDSED